MNRPRISVVITCFDYEDFVAEAIASALEQDPPPYEVVVVDDGSRDGSLRRIEAFGDRVHVIAQTNAGQAAGRKAQIWSHENTSNRVLDMMPPMDTVGWPTDTFFNEEKDIYFNGEAIEMIHQSNAHTDGDIIVFFRRSDVIAAGDVYINNVFPIFMKDNGGSYQGILNALNNIIDLTVPKEKQEGGTYVIPGHGRLADEADVVEWRDMNTIIRDRFADAIKKGQTLEQVKAANLVRDYLRYGANEGFWTTNSFVEAVYNSLKPAAPPAPTRPTTQNRNQNNNRRSN